MAGHPAQSCKHSHTQLGQKHTSAAPRLINSAAFTQVYEDGSHEADEQITPECSLLSRTCRRGHWLCVYCSSISATRIALAPIAAATGAATSSTALLTMEIA